tara:strand:+ start:664 stop:789 length:126 start_codon:yes stop_codon:yes gene_type:complete
MSVQALSNAVAEDVDANRHPALVLSTYGSGQVHGLNYCNIK